MIARAIAGFLLAFVIAFFARRRGVLSTQGGVAAVALGTLAMAAGFHWGALLVLYFVASEFLSAWQHAEKTSRTASIVEKTGARDAWQVLVNGSVYVLLALLASRTGSDAMSAAAIGALAASMADTAATEVGSAIGGQPRSIRRWEVVTPGTSGAVTARGTLAMVAGAALVALFAALLRFGWSAAALIGGIAGGVADSLLGSTVQERRRCPACGAATERRRHNCHPAGVMTDVVGGVRGFDNDWVNLTSTAIGAMAAAFSRGGV